MLEMSDQHRAPFRVQPTNVVAWVQEPYSRESVLHEGKERRGFHTTTKSFGDDDSWGGGIAGEERQRKREGSPLGFFSTSLACVGSTWMSSTVLFAPGR